MLVRLVAVVALLVVAAALAVARQDPGYLVAAAVAVLWGAALLAKTAKLAERNSLRREAAAEALATRAKLRSLSKKAKKKRSQKLRS